MKKWLHVFLLFLSCVSYSQTTEKLLQIKDAKTNEPVEGVVVTISKTKQTFISNANGEVLLSIKTPSTIQITHFSYQPETIRTITLTNEKNILLLKSIVKDLDDIVITKQHPQKILKSLIENSIKKFSIPARLKVYTREFFKLNGSYSYFNDGLINFQLSGQPKKIKTDILVEQNRFYGLTGDENLEDVLGYNLNNIMENYYGFKYLNPLKESSAQKQYDFIIKSSAKNAQHYIMTAIPIEDAKGVFDEFTIIYDNKNKVIVEVNTNLSQMTILKNDLKTINGKKIYKSNFKANYKIIDNEYYLISSKEEIGFEKETKGRVRDVQVTNYMVTSSFSKSSYTFKEDEIFKDQTLYNKKNHILSNYWEVSGLVSTDDEEKIIISLQDK